MSPGDRTAVLLDPHPLWLDAVELVLTRNGLAVVGQATDPDRALALVEELRPSVFVADAAGDGFACIRKACATVPELKAIVLSSPDDGAQIEAAFAAGAHAYVLKTAHPDDVSVAIRQTFDHSVFLPGPARRGGTGKHARRRRLGRKRHGGLTHEARARDPAAGRRRALEQPARETPLGDGADGEVPSLQHLPEAGRGQPDRSEPLGAGARSPEPRASGRGWQQRQLMRDEGDGGVEGEHHRGDLGDHLGQLDR